MKPAFKLTGRRVFWIALLFVFGILIFTGPHGSDPRPSPRIEQLARMKGIGQKLREYHDEHPDSEPDAVKGKSIADLVAMGVFDAEDAAYLSERHVQFYGYDPETESSRVPVLEAMYPVGGTRWQIVIYSDNSGTLHDLHAPQRLPQK